MAPRYLNGVEFPASFSEFVTQRSPYSRGFLCRLVPIMLCRVAGTSTPLPWTISSYVLPCVLKEAPLSLESPTNAVLIVIYCPFWSPPTSQPCYTPVATKSSPQEFWRVTGFSFISTDMQFLTCTLLQHKGSLTAWYSPESLMVHITRGSALKFSGLVYCH